MVGISTIIQPHADQLIETNKIRVTLAIPLGSVWRGRRAGGTTSLSQTRDDWRRASGTMTMMVWVFNLVFDPGSGFDGGDSSGPDHLAAWLASECDPRNILWDEISKTHTKTERSPSSPSC